MVNRIGVVLLIVLAYCIVLLVILQYYHHTNQQTQDRNDIPLNNIASLQLENRGKSKSLNVEPPGFVPVEDRIVLSHASYSNKFNDQIGTLNAEVIGYGTQEVVIPSDWYMKATPPTEFDGPYWPSGRIQPEFPAAQPDWYRPQRNQNASAAYSSVPSN
jgi:hypothetical protein